MKLVTLIRDSSVHQIHGVKSRLKSVLEAGNKQRKSVYSQRFGVQTRSDEKPIRSRVTALTLASHKYPKCINRCKPKWTTVGLNLKWCRSLYNSVSSPYDKRKGYCKQYKRKFNVLQKSAESFDRIHHQYRERRKGGGCSSFATRIGTGMSSIVCK